MTLDKGGAWLMVCYLTLSGKHFVAFCNGYNTTRFWNLTTHVRSDVTIFITLT
jgi:hypothetical protein